MPVTYHIPRRIWHRNVIGTWAFAVASPLFVTVALNHSTLAVWFSVVWTVFFLLAAINETRRPFARLKIDDESVTQYYPLSRQTWCFHAADIRRWSVIEQDDLDAMATLRCVSPEHRPEIRAAQAKRTTERSATSTDQPRRSCFLFTTCRDKLVYQIMPEIAFGTRVAVIHRWFSEHVGPPAEGSAAIYYDDALLSQFLFGDGPFDDEVLWNLPSPDGEQEQPPNR